MDGNLEPFRADVSTPKLDPQASAAKALQLITRACVQQVRANEPALLQTRAPEAVHQARVALRRWRTALSVFQEVMPEQAQELSEELRWLTGELNDIRDLDVFAEGLEDMARRDPAHARRVENLQDTLVRLRTAAHARAAEALASDRARRLLWEGARAADAAASVLDPAAPAARELAAAALSRQRRRIKSRAASLERLFPEDRHELRICAKKTRYIVELLGELFPGRKLQRRTVRTLKAMQEALGALNDIHVGQQIAARIAEEAGTAEIAFDAGLLAGARSACDETRQLKAAVRAYEGFASLEPFWRA